MGAIGEGFTRMGGTTGITGSGTGPGAKPTAKGSDGIISVAFPTWLWLGVSAATVMVAV